MSENVPQKDDTIALCCDEVDRLFNERLAECQEQITAGLFEIESRYSRETVIDALVMANMLSRLKRGGRH